MAPVGGTMCAASPARNRRPWRIGSATNERSGATLFSIDGPVARPAAASGRQAARARSQNRSSRPVGHVLVDRHLQVVAAARRRAHGAQRKAALVVGVDQLVVDGRHVGQDAEPAERIDALVDADHVLRDACRLTPWKPSQPAMKSQSISWLCAALAVAQARARRR